MRLDCLPYGVGVIFLFLGLVVSFENAAPLCFMLTICKNVVPECSRMLRWNYICVDLLSLILFLLLFGVEEVQKIW